MGEFINTQTRQPTKLLTLHRGAIFTIIIKGMQANAIFRNNIQKEHFGAPANGVLRGTENERKKEIATICQSYITLKLI